MSIYRRLIPIQPEDKRGAAMPAAAELYDELRRYADDVTVAVETEPRGDLIVFSWPDPSRARRPCSASP
jgi:hypothetical protein